MAEFSNKILVWLKSQSTAYVVIKRFINKT